MKPFFKAIIWYVVLQIMFIPIAFASGYDFSYLPTGGLAGWLAVLQLIVAVWTLGTYSVYEEEYRKKGQ